MWHFVADEGSRGARFKAHIVPDELLETVVSDLRERGLGNHSVKPITEYAITMPGVMMRDAHWYNFVLDELRLKVMAVDVPAFHEELRWVQERAAGGKTYYKLHGFLFAMCLTAWQRTALRGELERVLPEAEAIASSENDRFNRAMVGAPGLAMAPRPVTMKPGKA